MSTPAVQSTNNHTHTHTQCQVREMPVSLAMARRTRQATTRRSARLYYRNCSDLGRWHHRKVNRAPVCCRPPEVRRTLQTTQILEIGSLHSFAAAGLASTTPSRYDGLSIDAYLSPFAWSLLLQPEQIWPSLQERHVMNDDWSSTKYPYIPKRKRSGYAKLTRVQCEHFVRLKLLICNL